MGPPVSHGQILVFLAFSEHRTNYWLPMKLIDTTDATAHARHENPSQIVQAAERECHLAGKFRIHLVGMYLPR